MKVINIAGTNGSGKSTVVRKLLDLSNKGTLVMISGRTTPIGYDLIVPGVEETVHVAGDYGPPSGGCDTIKIVGEAFEHFYRVVEENKTLVYEGAFVMNMKQGPEFLRSLSCPFYLLLLTTPLETCFQAIADRRIALGKGGAFDHRRHVQNHHVRAQNYAAEMRKAGAKVRRVSRETAFETMMEILKS